MDDMKLLEGIHRIGQIECSDPDCLACAEHREDALELIAQYRAEARAEAASLYERQYEELQTWNAERSTQERWGDMIARHKHERDVFILGDEPKEREAESSRLLECSVCGNLEGAPYEQGDACSMCGVGVYRRAAIPNTVVERKLKEAEHA